MKLSELVKITSGYAFSSSRFNKDATGIPLIRIRDVTSNSISTYYDGIYDEKFVVDSGDYLISMDGEFNLSEWRNGRALLNQRVCKVDITSNLLSKKYLFYFLPKQLKGIEDKTPFVTVKHLSVSKILDIDIPVPSIEEQKRIVSLLDTAKMLCLKRKETVKLLDSYLASKFEDIFGNPRTNPKDWEKQTLKDITLKITDGTHQSPEFINYGIPFIFISNIVQNEITLTTKKFISEQTYQKLTKSTPIEKYDILYTTVGSYGNPAIVKTNDKFCFQRHIAHIKPDRNKTNVYFLYAMLKSPYIKRQADMKVKGVAQKTLNLGELSNFEVILPPMELQNNYASIVRVVEELKQSMLGQQIEFEKQFNSALKSSFSS